MNGVVALAEKDRSPPPQVGDLVTVDILLEEKIGKEGDEWTLGQQKWVGSGSLTLSTTSLRLLPSEGNTTKLAVDGIVHQPGPLNTGEIHLKHLPSGQEVTVAAGNLTVEIAGGEQTQENTELPWTAPTVPFGSWNYFLLGFLSLLLLCALFFIARRLLRRVRRRRQKNHRERALQALQGLQKYARGKKEMKQEEWKKFSFELAGIVRKFSDENFLIDTSDMTDREFLAELHLQPRAKGHVEALAGILSTIDEVRYGKKALDVTIVPSLLLDTRKFVENTFSSPEEGKA